MKRFALLLPVTLAVVGALALKFVFAATPGESDLAFPTLPAESAELKVAYFAGGCFWCMQYAFDPVPGVRQTFAGYSGGPEERPTYSQVSSGRTGHAESVAVFYDPRETSYEKLLDAFWHNIDPTVTDRQFADVGSQYRAAIFYRTDEEKRLAEASRNALAATGKFDRPVVTAIVPAQPFYPAEVYHQEYYRKHPMEFHAYHEGSGRASYLRQKWGGGAASH